MTDNTPMKVVELLEFNQAIDPFSLDHEYPLDEVARFLKEANIGFVFIKEGDKIVGILSERDIVFKSTQMNKQPKKQKARDVMVTEFVSVHAKDDLKDALVEMKKIGCRHLPVKDDSEEIIGLISERDIISYLLSKLSR